MPDTIRKTKRVTNHIHVDAHSPLSEEFERYLLVDLGFVWTQFDEPEEPVEDYYPRYHLTRKFYDRSEFKSMQKLLYDYLENSDDPFDGYAEFEALTVDQRLNEDEKPFNPGIEPSFRISPENWKKLHGAKGPDSFRESEIHLGMDAERSDPRLIERLTDMGFMVIFNTKEVAGSKYRQIIFTMQGSPWETIDDICQRTIRYIDEAGGAVNCDIIEERITTHWLSGPHVARPPIITAEHFEILK